MNKIIKGKKTGRYQGKMCEATINTAHNNSNEDSSIFILCRCR
jgi:hypothetical protein